MDKLFEISLRDDWKTDPESVIKLMEEIAHVDIKSIKFDPKVKNLEYDDKLEQLWIEK